MLVKTWTGLNVFTANCSLLGLELEKLIWLMKQNTLQIAVGGCRKRRGDEKENGQCSPVTVGEDLLGICRGGWHRWDHGCGNRG